MKIKREMMLTEWRKSITKEEINQFPVLLYSGNVVVIEDGKQADEAIEFLSDFSYIGFDTETKPSFQKGASNKVSLLQLALEGRVYLFRLNKCGFRPSIRRFMADPRITKIGVGIRDDLRGLRKLGEFLPASFVDLQEFVVKFGIEDKSFTKLMAIVFKVKISKRQRTSNWEVPVLTEAQIRYAATDAWGALAMYYQLAAGTVK